MAQQPPLGQGFLVIEASLSHLDTPHSVRLLWTGDKPEAETSTLQHTTLIRDRNPYHRVGFEHVITANERSQTHVLYIHSNLKGTEDRAVHRVLEVRTVHRERQRRVNIVHTRCVLCSARRHGT